MSLSKSPELILVAKKTSRELRRDQTKAEEIFWEAVRGHRFMGLKFYRQHPLFFDFQGKETFFIADFYCHKHRIVIEIDGRIHDFNRKRDEARTRVINALGVQVLRFRNEEIKRDIKVALERLKVCLTR
ncbi:MAG: hypothetical protein HW412_1625 [Bacteroidetes bacterium]|nr:hypothetical protein [Bacteroidota bacterium]